MKFVKIKALLAVILLLSLTLPLISCSDATVTGTQSDSGAEASDTESHEPDSTSSTEPSTTPDTMRSPEPETTAAPVTTPPITEIDLTAEKDLSYELLCTTIKQNPMLEFLRADTLTLTAQEYISLCKINSKVKLNLTAKVEYEKSVYDLTKDEIDISKKTISDKDTFSALLSCFPNGIKLVMCDCNYTNEEMGALRENNPHVTFAWRVYMGERWSLRTDDEAFSVMIRAWDYTRMKNEDIEVLKYCTELRALDIGHQAVTDISVLSGLTELRVLIIADNKITDLTPLKNLKKLEYLEFFMNKVTDLTPLAECTELIDLNFGWNYKIADLTPIYSLKKIERLWLPTTAVKEEQHEEIIAAFPNAKIIFKDVDSTSSGWREHPRYKPMRNMFKYNKYDENFASYKE